MMNDSGSAQQPEVPDEDALRRRLINRIVFAGIAVVALLGGLAVIDSLYVAPTAPVPKVVTPLPIAEVTKPVDMVSVPVAAPEAPAAPEPPKPEAVPSIKTATAPEESSSPAGVLPRQLPAQELAQQGPAAAPGHVPSRPLTRGGASERRFVLQMGVFNNVENAQELLAKLHKGGVPAQIEARVQVGPFKTRKEAENARAKLDEMGLDAGLLMAIHR